MADPNADPAYVPIPFPAVYYSPAGPPVMVSTPDAVPTGYVAAPVPPTADALLQQANVATDVATATVVVVTPPPTDAVPVSVPIVTIVETGV